MCAQGLPRRLAAMLSADVAGYSRLMAQDESATIHLIEAYRTQIGALVLEHRGRLVDATGDNLLAEFPSALDCIEAALEIQRVLGARNASLDPARRMEFRIGVHVGDVSSDGDRIYGDGVNISARLARLAEPGGICVSADVVHQVRNRVEIGFDDLGEQPVKNIPQPVHAYRVIAKPKARRTARARRPLAVALLGVAALAAVGFWLWRARDARAPQVIEKSVAVLPFVNLAADPANEYFADGLSEELIDKLAQLPGLKVAARTSSFFFKNRNSDVREIGERLQVGTVLEGSVRRQGSRVRIAAQLINATDGYHLWSQTYEREVDDVFAIQSDIASRVAEALRVSLLESDVARIQTRGTSSAAAYDAYLLGLGGVSRYTVGSLPEAADYFRRAIELDPDFAKAYVGLANASILEFWTAPVSREEMLGVAAPAAERAVSLDPMSSEAWAAIGAVRRSQGDAAAAESAFHRALELNPRNTNASAHYAGFLLDRLRADEARRVAENGMSLDPYAEQVCFLLGCIYRQLNRSDAIGPAFARCRELDPSNPNGVVGAELQAWWVGDLARAVTWNERAIDIDPNDPEMPAFLALTQLTLENSDPAESLATSALGRNRRNGFLIATRALVHLQRGDRERAFELARVGLEPDHIQRHRSLWLLLRMQSLDLIKNGKLDEAVRSYERAYPTLARGEPLLDAVLDGQHQSAEEVVHAALDLARLRGAANDDEGKRRLTRRLRELPALPLHLYGDSGTIEAELRLLEGRTREALESLEQEVDAGWRLLWQWNLVLNPAFDAVRDDPTYLRVVAKLEADMARQRQLLAASAAH